MSRVTLTNLLPGVAYGVQLRAISDGSFSNWSRTFNITPTGDITAPAVPTGLVTSQAGTSFIASWNANTEDDFLKYVVRITATSFGTVYYDTVATTFELSLDLNRSSFTLPRPTVEFSVAAMDRSGNISAYVGPSSQTNPAPANPTSFVGSVGPDVINLKWTGVADTDLMEYRIYSGTSAGTQATLIWKGFATSAAIQSIEYSTDKWFKVAAVDVFGTESATPPVVGPLRPTSAFLVDTIPPGVPAGLAATLTNATDGKTAQAVVTWTAVSDPDNDLAEYILGYKPSATSDWQYTKVDYTNTGTTLLGLLPYVNYDFRIRSSDFAANLSAWSSTLTKTATANAAPAVPTGLTVLGSRDSLRINWTANTEPDMAYGAGVYDVTVATNSGFSTGVLQYRTGADNIVVNGLASGTTYWARVRATDSGGLSSAYATGVSATTGALISAFSYTINATAPSSPNVGDLWMDTTTGFEKRWSGSAWVNTGNVSLQYINARGTDLITNGNGTMGNNYNFAAYDYDGTDAPTGAQGSFVIKTTGAQSALISEYIPFDPSKDYKFSFKCRQTVAGQTNTMYGFIAPYDAFGNGISPQCYMYGTGTTTTLAADLNPGATTVTLTSSANWYGTSGKNAGASTHLRGFIFWDYVDSGGKEWPIGSYSRNNYLNLYADNSITGNVITLNAPWAGPAKLAGTPLSQSSSGGSFMYMPSALATVVPETWTQYDDIFSAGVMSSAAQEVPAGGAATWSLGVPPGTAKILVGWLMNYPAGGTGKHAIAAVSFSDASAAQETADIALASANGKNKVIHSTSAASGTVGYVAGDIWFRYDGSDIIIGQWRFSGSSWVPETVGNQVIATLDAGKLTANSAFVTTLNIGSGGVIQSAGYTGGGTTGFQLGTTGLTIKGTNNVVDAGVLKGGVITGTTINVGAGGVLNIDSTAVVKSNNYAAGSTGYQLTNAALEINDGTVDAKALKTGSAIIGDLTIGRSADALGTIKSFDYVAATTGWKIGKGLFEINDGAIKAAALQIQSGPNLESPEYASFDFVPSFYTGKIPATGSTQTIIVGGAKFGSQYLQCRATGAAVFGLSVGLNTTDYHIPLEPLTTYIVSAWMKTGTVATNVSFRIRQNTGYTASFGGASLGASGAWQRVTGTITTSAGISSGLIVIDSNTATTGAGFDVDGIQIERQIGNLTTPSPWSPPGMTFVDGGIIRTGEMRSTASTTVNGVSQPAWSINMSGNAQFGDALVRGKILVGQSGADADAGQSFISSGNYVAATTGWKMDSAGNLEANAGTFRGTLSGGTILGGSAQFPASGVGVPGFVQMDSNGFQVVNDSTTNLCTNPSMESLTGVAASSGTTAVLGGAAVSDYVANTDITSYVGQKALKVYNTTANGYVDINVGAANASTTYTVSWFSATTNIADTIPVANVNGDYSVMGVFRSDTSARIATGRTGHVIIGGGPFQGYQEGALATGIALTAFLGWQLRTWLTFTTPAGMPAGTVLKLRLPAPRAAGDTNETTLAVVYDGIQMEQKSYMTRYTDGEQPGCYWNGTGHASTSSRPVSKAFWVPTFDDPVFNGQVNAPVVRATKIKLGTGTAHGTNYIERFNYAGQSFNNAAWTPVPFESNSGGTDRTAADDGAMTGQDFTEFRANNTGMWNFFASYGFTTNTTGIRGWRVVVHVAQNGTDHVVAQRNYTAASMASPATHTETISAQVYMAEGWTVELQVYQNSGGVLAGHTHGTTTPCRATLAQVG